MFPMQRQEKHDVLQIDQNHCCKNKKTFKISHNLTCNSNFLTLGSVFYVKSSISEN